MPLFKRLSNKQLRAEGWNPRYIVKDPDAFGPYAAVRLQKAICVHCGHSTVGWTIVDLTTGMGHSREWTGDEADIEAQSTVNVLNTAWSHGYHSAKPDNQ